MCMRGTELILSVGAELRLLDLAHSQCAEVYNKSYKVADITLLNFK